MPEFQENDKIVWNRWPKELF